MNNQIEVRVTLKDGFNSGDVITFVRATGGSLLGAQGQTMDFSINKRILSHLRSHDAVQSVVEVGATEVQTPPPTPEVSQETEIEEVKEEELKVEVETETKEESEDENEEKPGNLYSTPAKKNPTFWKK